MAILATRASRWNRIAPGFTGYNARAPGLLAKLRALALVVLLLAGWPEATCAYSVLAHEAIIDVVWDSHIRPLLRKRFPGATAEELNTAHGYAYGGAIIQDLGYYPHGSHLFSDLTHYVRSADFIVALLRDAEDVNEYAFALGALAHCPADVDGHRIGTNRAVPILYPKLERQYGAFVTYEDNPLAHVKTEFGFDVLEVAKGRYAPDDYHRFIGFGVSQRLIEQAFQETYGVALEKVLSNEEKTIGSYRRDVSKWIPKATRVAWTLKKDEIQADQPGVTKRKFLYNLSRASYEKNWGQNYKQPTAGEKFLAFLWKLVPKFGPLKVLELKTPTPQTEQMFQASFNAALDGYRGLLNAVKDGNLRLPNLNFDVGEPTPPGKYFMNDQAHAKLLDLLASQNFAGATPELRNEMIEYFSHPEVGHSAKMKPKEWAKVQAQVEQLRAAAVVQPAATLAPSRIRFSDNSDPAEPQE